MQLLSANLTGSIVPKHFCFAMSLGAVFLSASFSPAFAASDSVDWPEVYTKARPSVATLWVSRGLCSGSVVAPDLVLTAWHCVSDLSKVGVYLPSEAQGKEPIMAEVVAKDAERDLAVLRLQRAVCVSPLPIRGEDVPLQHGERLATIGNPMAIGAKEAIHPLFGAAISTGVLSGFDEDNVVTDVSLSPGNSGGPILDSSGAIVSVASRIYRTVASDGLGIGAVPKHVAALVQRAKEEKPEPLPFYAAKGSLQLRLSVAKIEAPDVDDPSIFSHWGFALRTEFFGGALVEGGYLCSTDAFTHCRYHAEAGYAFTLRLKGRPIVKLTPTLGYVKEQGVDVDSALPNRLGLTLSGGILDIGLYYRLDDPGNEMGTMATLVLPFY